MKTADLIGPALDWAVAAALATQFNEPRVVKVCRVEATTPAWIERENGVGSAPYYHRFDPSTEWSQAGPIIEREGINWRRGNDLVFPRGNENGDFTEPLWLASIRSGPVAHGRTPLIAAMRCFVAAKLGDEVDVPQELT